MITLAMRFFALGSPNLMDTSRSFGGLTMAI